MLFRLPRKDTCAPFDESGAERGQHTVAIVIGQAEPFPDRFGDRFSRREAVLIDLDQPLRLGRIPSELGHEVVCERGEGRRTIHEGVVQVDEEQGHGRHRTCDEVSVPLDTLPR